MSNIFDEFTKIGTDLIHAFADIIEFLGTPVSELAIRNTIVTDIINIVTGGAISLWNLFIDTWGDYTLFSVMLGSGLTFVLIYNLIKWVVGLVTGS